MKLITSRSLIQCGHAVIISQSELIPCSWFTYLCMGSHDDAVCNSFVSIVMDIRKEIKLLQ